MNIQHSARTDQWATPLWVLDKVRKALGGIDLDPASDAVVNADRVRARRFIDAAEDALAPDTVWGTVKEPVSIFLNPPGGKRGNKSVTSLFWQRLMRERDLGTVREAIFMCFSVEALQNTQGKGCLPAGAFPFCVPARRIAFDSMAGDAKQAPSHSNAIVYVPGTVAGTLFLEQFRDVGTISRPWL